MSVFCGVVECAIHPQRGDEEDGEEEDAGRDELPQGEADCASQSVSGRVMLHRKLHEAKSSGEEIETHLDRVVAKALVPLLQQRKHQPGLCVPSQHRSCPLTSL